MRNYSDPLANLPDQWEIRPKLCPNSAVVHAPLRAGNGKHGTGFIEVAVGPVATNSPMRFASPADAVVWLIARVKDPAEYVLVRTSYCGSVLKQVEHLSDWEEFGGDGKSSPSPQIRPGSRILTKALV